MGMALGSPATRDSSFLAATAVLSAERQWDFNLHNRVSMAMSKTPVAH